MNAAHFQAERFILRICAGLKSNPPRNCPPIDAVVFALDGAMVDTVCDVAVALNRTQMDFYCPPTTKEIAETLLQKGVRTMIECAFRQAYIVPSMLDRAAQRYEQHFQNLVGKEAELLPGVFAGLCLFHAAGFKLALLSDKSRRSTMSFLEKVGIDCLFTTIICNDDCDESANCAMLTTACRQMRIMPSATLMIGESIAHLPAAKAAGCLVWLVPSGANESCETTAYQCDRFVATISDAAQLLCTDTLRLRSSSL